MTWEDIACGCSFGYIGKFDKKGLHESDLSSCGKRKIVCRRMKNQSQANDFSFGAYFYAVFKSLKKRNIEKWRGFFLSRKNL
ncbi:hypothetical protein HMPREF9441_03703 [Paraprevotella clara YIT 11840]|uniref:Uncharacterized protein n=1 Tax=Paraprevotella clara YIT 11840 TaxID=762968 RepID=G5SWD0_9BACT|nr:hypothetical protein HMPREF9441_03703 [Paraprevotella clara YIT 11840]